MSSILGTEKIVNPLQQSALNKKGLCDYVINVASGCLHGCTFCYVPSTPAIRTRQTTLKEQGVDDPQMEWGKYLFIRKGIPQQLETILSRKRTWNETPSGRGVVLLCSGTDPYQNGQTAKITRQVIEILLKYNKRIRLLTRSPLWLNDLDVLIHPNVTVGMSLPYLDNSLSRKIEPNSPPPCERYKALIEGQKAGCRLYVAVAPTPPQMLFKDFKEHLEMMLEFDPEVIFWEPINARGTNGKRMLEAGLEFVQDVVERRSWAEYFIRQWAEIELAAEETGCMERLHIWPDQELSSYVDLSALEYWWYKPTPEKWGDNNKHKCNADRPRLSSSKQLCLSDI